MESRKRDILNRFVRQIRLAVSVAIVSSIATPVSAVDFNRDIRPILSNHCFQCHGPDEENREADLRLDREESATTDRGGYAVVDRNAPRQSEFLVRIFSDDPDTLMPPPDLGKPLSADQRQLLRQWIEEGASWQQHWAYVVPHPQPLPTGDWLSEVPEWPENWIDYFVASRLSQEGLSPAGDADDVTLVRRLSFDLTGLPPSPEIVQRFEMDRSPDRITRLVDTLLASPAFGERMAMYWLDLVRFADTVGYHGDQDHNVAPYREYVINSFNDNKPFDQFTWEQLAGDLLPSPTPEQIVATCYNRLLQTSHEGGVQPKEYLAIYAADRVRNVSAVWMGATLGCAQCHDHKYDPYTSKDFYAMAAFFADIDEEKHFKVGTNALPTARPPEIDVVSRWRRERIERLQEQKQRLIDNADKLGESEPQARADIREAIERIENEINRLQQEKHRVMITVPLEQPRTIRLLPRGNWLDDSGPIIEPAIPEFLGKIGDGSRRLTRLDLAKWLTDIDQAGYLTARVFVNRMWYLFFGTGLSNSLDDFGGQGEPPRHPELLDQLTVAFVRSGWDVKQLVKTLVTSHTYRQSSEADAELVKRDPENRLYARQSRFRLDAEMIRDNVLCVAGLLNRQIGGRSAKPYQPAGYYRHLNFPQRKYKHDENSQQWRRGVYVHWQRQFLHPMLKVFDAPSREECTAKRPRSNTPLAALSLLNDPTFVESARMLAVRVLAHDKLEDDRQRLNRAFEYALSRSPDSTEQQALEELLEFSRQQFDQDRAVRFLGVGVAKVPPSVDMIELASWATVARAILNLSDVLYRN